MNDATLTETLASSRWVALCAHCSQQRRSDPGSAELEEVATCVISGCCHDCGGGYCLCGGYLACERCPRKNARVILEKLTVWRLVVPEPPSTQPAPLG